METEQMKDLKEAIQESWIKHEHLWRIESNRTQREFEYKSGFEDGVMAERERLKESLFKDATWLSQQEWMALELALFPTEEKGEV